MIVHPRIAIRKYLIELLKDKIDIGNRVIAGRPNPFNIRNLPCLAVYFTIDSPAITSGDIYIPKIYERTLTINIDIICEQPTDPDNDLLIDDELDIFAGQIEAYLHEDRFFSRKLSSYTGNFRDPGLINGLNLSDTTPYNIETGGERLIGAQNMQINLIYNDYAIFEHKANIFEEYYMEVTRQTAVDPILIAAEGDL
jgi:hypothetical protein